MMSAPTRRTTTFDDAIAHIDAESIIWVRVAALRQEDDTWHARLLELTSGAAPPSWEPHEWEYPSVLLAAVAQSGEAVTGWLRTCQIPLDDCEIRLPQMTTSITWERRQSRSSAEE